jgi:polynucleotide 5'-hydroxyl-kinase GRC3/NOL9
VDFGSVGSAVTDLHIPDDWRAAIDRILAEPFSRVAIIGPTDTGKSSFARALLAADPGFELIDADPGQKLVGPPGTVSLGRAGPAGLDLGGYLFIGSTSASNVFLIARACEALAAASPRFVANTSGFVEKLGVRLQAATLSALGADLVVAIGEESAVAPILAKHPDRAAIRLKPSPNAARKTPAARARLRQASFAAALAGAESFALTGVAFEPAPPIAIALGARHPVCSLADAEGTDMAIGIVEAAADGTVRVLAPPPDRPVATVRLGRMWAEPRDGAWALLDTLHPSWIHDEPEG